MHAQRTDGICTTDKWHSPRKRFSQKSTFFLTLYKFWCNYEFLHTPMTMTKYLPYGYKTLAMGPMPQYTKCPGGGYSFWQKPNNVIKDPRLMDHVQERGGGNNNDWLQKSFIKCNDGTFWWTRVAMHPSTEFVVQTKKTFFVFSWWS